MSPLFPITTLPLLKSKNSVCKFKEPVGFIQWFMDQAASGLAVERSSAKELEKERSLKVKRGKKRK